MLLPECNYFPNKWRNSPNNLFRTIFNVMMRTPSLLSWKWYFQSDYIINYKQWLLNGISSVVSIILFECAVIVSCTLQTFAASSTQIREKLYVAYINRLWSGIRSEPLKICSPKRRRGYFVREVDLETSSEKQWVADSHILDNLPIA